MRKVLLYVGFGGIVVGDYPIILIICLMSLDIMLME